ncbi:unnamed protein product, partial [marine sediment metagenome]
EMRSEVFSQGTLMLRLVIQVSMGLAIPLMACCLFIWPSYAPWYISYVLLFNMLVGPVFSAGSITNERERQTLDLLLTTTLSPWTILWGKLVSGLRVSSVLTLFLLWPVLLACVMIDAFWSNLPTMVGYVAIVLLTCLTTSVTALVCSVLADRTAVSLVMTYVIIVTLFTAPLAAVFFADTFFPDAPATQSIEWTGASSPFAAALSLPLDCDSKTGTARPANLPLFLSHFAFFIVYNLALLATMT